MNRRQGVVVVIAVLIFGAAFLLTTPHVVGSHGFDCGTVLSPGKVERFPWQAPLGTAIPHSRDECAGPVRTRRIVVVILAGLALVGGAAGFLLLQSRNDDSAHSMT